MNEIWTSLENTLAVAWAVRWHLLVLAVFLGAVALVEHQARSRARQPVRTQPGTEQARRSNSLPPTHSRR